MQTSIYISLSSGNKQLVVDGSLELFRLLISLFGSHQSADGTDQVGRLLGAETIGSYSAETESSGPDRVIDGS